MVVTHRLVPPLRAKHSASTGEASRHQHLGQTNNPNDGMLRPYSDELANIAETVRCATVQVLTTEGGAGSGIIWPNRDNQESSIIITNAHVASRWQAKVELADGQILPATRIGYDQERDLAALQVLATHLPTATIGDSDAVKVGELVVAVGNPHGVKGAFTMGIIHSLPSAQTLPSPFAEKDWLMADLTLAPGNSGGPMADIQGRVIGINTAITGGFALAVPGNQVERFLQQATGKPYLGVTLRPLRVVLPTELVLGLAVLEVASGSLAAQANLRRGDVLLGICGQHFHTTEDLLAVLRHAQPGEDLPLEYLRDGSLKTAVVVVGGSVYQDKVIPVWK